MMFDDETIADLRMILRKTGTLMVTDGNGKKMFLVTSAVLPVDHPGILLAYEGHGALFFELDRPLNQFRLITAGFSIKVAPFLAELVNRLVANVAIEKTQQRAIAPPVSRKRKLT